MARQYLKSREEEAEEEDYNRLLERKATASSRPSKTLTQDPLQCPELPERTDDLDMLQLRSMALQCIATVSTVKAKSGNLQERM